MRFVVIVAALMLSGCTFLRETKAFPPQCTPPDKLVCKVISEDPPARECKCVAPKTEAK